MPKRVWTDEEITANRARALEALRTADEDRWRCRSSLVERQDRKFRYCALGFIGRSIGMRITESDSSYCRIKDAFGLDNGYGNLPSMNDRRDRDFTGRLQRHTGYLLTWREIADLLEETGWHVGLADITEDRLWSTYR